MDNKRYYYLAEGECEEKLLKALKLNPALIHSGEVKKFSVIQDEIPVRKLMQFAPGSVVVFVFDTDVEETATLKKNIELLKSLKADLKVFTVEEVLNFEDELERSTNVTNVQAFTKSKTVRDFKSDVNKMKESDFRNALKRHKLDMSKLWSQKPPKAFKFVTQDGEKIKVHR